MTWIETCRLRELTPLAAVDEVPLAHLRDATCGAVENYCGRKFAATTYDEMYQGSGSRSLFLHQTPVTAIQGVRYVRQVALQIQNTTEYIQAATVAVTNTALVLTFINNATTTTETLTYADNPTLGDLDAAIDALGNGWQSFLSPAFTTWASSDLAAYKTTQSARQVVATISPHYYYLSGYKADFETGELVLPSGWYGGYQGYRIQYTAGYSASTIPQELVQAACELAAATFQAAKSDPNLNSESLGGYSYSRAAGKSIADLSVQSRQTLDYYRRRYVPLFRAGW